MSVGFAPASPDPATLLVGYDVTLRDAKGAAAGYRRLDPATTSASFASLPAGTYTADVQAIYSNGQSAVERSPGVVVPSPVAVAPTPADVAASGLGPPVVTGRARFGSVLSCSSGRWSLTGAASVSREWLRNGRATGATTPTHRVVRADEGQWLGCRVRLRTPIGDGRVQTSAALRVADLLRNVSTPGIAGRHVVGASLTCTHGHWRHTGPVAFRYTWRRGSRTIATGSRYRLKARDADAVIGCVVRARGTVESEQAPTGSILVVRR